MKLILFMLAIIFVADVSLDITRLVIDSDVTDDKPWEDN